MSGSAPGALRKRSVMIAGHRTSVSLEAAFWEALREVATTRGASIQALIGAIDAERGAQNLSSAIRVFVLRAFRDPPTRPKPGLPGSGLQPAMTMSGMSDDPTTTDGTGGQPPERPAREDGKTGPAGTAGPTAPAGTGTDEAPESGGYDRRPSAPAPDNAKGGYGTG